MKHNYTVITVLIMLFIISQLTGLLLLNMDVTTTRDETGRVEIIYSDTALGERPETTPLGGLILIMFGLLIGTGILLLLIKYNKINVWKTWFFLASTIAIALALNVFLNTLLAWLLAITLTTLRIKIQNVITQNVAEILMYSGLAIFLVPILDVTIMIILLILISLYDMYAVWKSKHMIKMANFTSKNNLFPGLSLKYKVKHSEKPTGKKVKTGILGGGDVVFPLLFTGVVMQSLILEGTSKTIAFQQSLIITLTTTIALASLLLLGQKEKFYPAMPFITFGLIIGYLLI